MVALLWMLSLLPAFERELRLLPKLLGPGRVAIDVGASLGVYALPMAMVVGASGLVVALEPRVDAAVRLQRLAEVLRLHALRVEALALGSMVGRDHLVVPGRKRLVPGRSFMASGVVSADLDDGLVPHHRQGVNVDTLDAVRCRIGRKIDLIKCDVEGAEFDVFLGGRNVLGEDRPFVLCEIEDRHTRRYGRAPGDVVDMLAEFDYRPVQTPPGLDNRNVLFMPPRAVRGWPRSLGDRDIILPPSPAAESRT